MGLLQRQLAVPVVSSNGNLHYATSVQDAGVPDDLYSYKGRLGAIFRHPDTASEFEEFTQEPDGDIRIKWGSHCADDEAVTLRDRRGLRSFTSRSWLQDPLLQDPLLPDPGFKILASRSLASRFVACIKTTPLAGASAWI